MNGIFSSRAYLDKDVALSEELVQKYSNVVLGHFNKTVKELRRLFLVDDLVDSLKFAVLMWVFTYVGALFNGLTLLILGEITHVDVLYLDISLACMEALVCSSCAAFSSGSQAITTFHGFFVDTICCNVLRALISLFSIPVIYEKHQAQIDHYVGLVNKNVKDGMAKIQAKIPGLKRKAE
ncbi:hypothetical protein JD844_025642 [Phrynosoma platyrhinos]|uniref:Reticulon n=1 Tax=Phrynosoma platyrhinos TaxID=52577 RepID=A0ABQ7T035_PHRPL|nr:hypothetical protein JD844_025642 [Phrynosoma platyrhinos]